MAGYCRAKVALLPLMCRAALAYVLRMTNLTSNLQCNGEKIRRQRIGMSLTQEKLAAMSNTNVRTVQRAESGAAVQMETAASLAAALNFTVADIIKKPMLDEEGKSLDEFNAVALRPISSSKMLMDVVCDSFSAKLTCKAEPTAENIEALVSFSEMLEEMLPDPWSSAMENVSLSFADRIRVSVSLSDRLSRLDDLNISVYAGTYTASAKVPRYDVDEGHMYTHVRQKFEPVTACRVLVDRSGLERVVEQVSDKWEAPSPCQSEKPLGTDDEIPY